MQIVNLRKAGMDWASIAKKTGMKGPARAYERFMAVMKTYPREDVEEARNVESDRLDQVQLAIWTKCLTGDTWAIDRFLKLSDQRARLLGLNVPVPPAPVGEAEGQEQRRSALAEIFELLQTTGTTRVVPAAPPADQGAVPPDTA